MRGKECVSDFASNVFGIPNTAFRDIPKTQKGKYADTYQIICRFQLRHGCRDHYNVSAADQP